MSKWKCQRGPFRRGCLEIDEGRNHVVNQPRVSTQKWRSGSEPRRESVLTPYQDEITYTLPRSRARTQGWLLRFTSVRTLLQCLSDVFMIIWQDRHTHSLTHLPDQAIRPHHALVQQSFDEVCGGLSASWWKRSVSSRYAPQLKKYTDSFTFSRSKSPTGEKWHDYGDLAWNM